MNIKSSFFFTDSNNSKMREKQIRDCIFILIVQESEELS